MLSVGLSENANGMFAGRFQSANGGAGGVRMELALFGQVGIPITDLGSDVLWSRDLNVAID